MRNTFFALVGLLSLTLSAVGQSSDSTSNTALNWQEIKQRIYLEPNGNFLILNQQLILGLSPVVGYRIKPTTIVGLGPTYNYYKVLGVDLSTYEAGGRAFFRQALGERLFAQAEYEQLSREVAIVSPQGTVVDWQRQWVPGLLLGGGLYQPFNQRSGLILAAFYNLLWDPLRSRTASPLVTRVGFAF